MSSEARRQDEMIIRILPDGKIVIDGSALPPRRLLEIQQSLQETVGKTTMIDPASGDSPDAPSIWGRANAEKTATEDAERESKRQRQGAGE